MVRHASWRRLVSLSVNSQQRPERRDPDPSPISVMPIFHELVIMKSWLMYVGIPTVRIGGTTTSASAQVTGGSTDSTDRHRELEGHPRMESTFLSCWAERAATALNWQHSGVVGLFWRPFS